MIEYTHRTTLRKCDAHQLESTSLHISSVNHTINNIDKEYNYQKNLLILLSELNFVERQINEQRHRQLESILSTQKKIDKYYIQLITQHNSINLDIINIRKQVYSMLSDS